MGKKSRDARAKKGAPARAKKGAAARNQAPSGGTITCTMFACDNLAKTRCAQCRNALCSVCICGSLVAIQAGTWLTLKCPFCRNYNFFFSSTLLKGVLHESGKAGQLLEIPTCCSGCHCDHNVPMAIKLQPCGHGCHTCDRSSIEVFVAP